MFSFTKINLFSDRDNWNKSFIVQQHHKQTATTKRVDSDPRRLMSSYLMRQKYNHSPDVITRGQNTSKGRQL